MKFTTLFFFMTLVLSVFSLPLSESLPVTESPAQTLEKRRIRFPVRADDELSRNVMAKIKANFDTGIFATISARFTENALASLKIHATVLGGLVSVGNVHLRALQSAAGVSLRAAFQASLDAKVRARIYEPVEKDLNKQIGSASNQTLGESDLLSIIADKDKKIAALIRTELPKIGLDLEAEAKQEIDMALDQVEVNLPLVIQVVTDIDVDAKSSIKVAVQLALQLAADLDIRSNAKEILDSL